MARRVVLPEAHIIDNLDCVATLCGRYLATMPRPDDLTPQALVRGEDVAIWDDAEWPEGFTICRSCQRAYG
jgi:hypothetical protein